MAVAVRPEGRVSVTVTVPLVAWPPWLVAVRKNWSPVSAWVKLPLWLLLTIMSDGVRTLVESLAVSLAVLDWPPPDTVTLLVNGVPALEDTLTVSVMGFMLAPAATVLVLVQLVVASVQVQP